MPCGANSVDAVSSMQIAQSKNMGRSASREHLPGETPDATRSVTGNGSNRNKDSVDQHWYQDQRDLDLPAEHRGGSDVLPSPQP